MTHEAVGGGVASPHITILRNTVMNTTPGLLHPVSTARPAPPTYFLRGTESTSDRYYRDIADVTDRTLAMGGDLAGELVDQLMDELRVGRDEVLRTREEYLFDVLTLGVMWRCRGGRAERTHRSVSLLLTGLVELRQRFLRLKPTVDRLRGWLAPALLLGDGRGTEGAGVPGRNGLRALLRWMTATGEYREEVKRLERVVAHLEGEEIDAYVRHVDGIILYADRFLRFAGVQLGAYTAGVDAWIHACSERTERREDTVLRLRPRAEYHLSMVGAEVLNRALQPGYERTRERALLLPACMRGPHAVQCRARRMDLDMICTGCSTGCRVNALTHLAAAQGVGVHLIPHSSDFTRWLRTWAAERDLGVVGVACVLHLITGGLELRALGIPAQCVLLDNSGCVAHWDPDGQATDLNESLLSSMLDARVARDAAA
jgi:uncharacterized protein